MTIIGQNIGAPPRSVGEGGAGSGSPADDFRAAEPHSYRQAGALEARDPFLASRNSEEAEVLRSQASRCRRLGMSISDPKAEAALEQLAVEYEQRADDLLSEDDDKV